MGALPATTRHSSGVPATFRHSSVSWNLISFDGRMKAKGFRLSLE
jgi:hypothetical protein